MVGERRERQYDFSEKPTAVPQSHAPTRGPPAPKQHGPEKSFRSGALQVTIWENENLTAEGQVQSYKTISFDRRYKDKTGEWKSSNSLRVNDLPKAALLLNKAYEHLVMNGEDDE